MFKEAHLPKIGEIWTNGFYDVFIKDIWNSKSEASGEEFKTILCVQANYIVPIDAVIFSSDFELVKAVEENFPEKEFELEQTKLKLERLIKLST
jgi:hypothetical protein